MPHYVHVLNVLIMAVLFVKRRKAESRTAHGCITVLLWCYYFYTLGSKDP